MNAKQQLGQDGEDRAARWYVNNGYEILDRNWRSGRLGEVDIVARGNGVLVICEVKTRSSHRYGTPLEAVTVAKQVRLRKLGLSYLAAHSLSSIKLRFDIVAITGVEVRVLPGIF